MGYLQSGICFENINSAYQSYGSSFPIPVPTPFFYAIKLFKPALTSGVAPNVVTGLYQLDYFNVTPAGVSYKQSIIVSPPTFPICDPLQPFLSGMYFSSVVAVAFITISILTLLRRAL